MKPNAPCLFCYLNLLVKLIHFLLISRTNKCREPNHRTQGKLWINTLLPIFEQKMGSDKIFFFSEIKKLMIVDHVSAQ